MAPLRNRAEQYFATLAALIGSAEVTDRANRPISIEDAFDRVTKSAHAAHDGGRKLMFVGNGGSAGIASHLAIDFSKNGGIRAMAFNDPAALTCLGNDLGYENVFGKQLDLHAQAGDLLIAISSSGRSPNILNGVAVARQRGCEIVTFSGFADSNPLRSTGDVNFYVRSHVYGFVEVAHLSICHCLLDLDGGWSQELTS
ncbi:MAG TPA: SIS domain-containing protein [Methyloceanibacter sp.]|jgi:D-sedoheptulose 7-phosphate isomerase